MPLSVELERPGGIARLLLRYLGTIVLVILVGCLVRWLAPSPADSCEGFNHYRGGAEWCPAP